MEAAMIKVLEVIFADIANSLEEAARNETQASASSALFQLAHILEHTTDVRWLVKSAINDAA